MRRALALGLFVALLAVPAALGHASARRTVQFDLIAHLGPGPLYVTAPKGAPGGTIYVVRQGGEIDALTGSKSRVFANVASKISTNANERGLLSMAFNPAYKKNHLVYLSYTDPNGDSRVVRYRTNGVTLLPSTGKTLLFVKQPFSNHNGGQLQFGPDGKLYVGYGDGGSGGDPGNRAQNPATKLGKLLRLDVTKSKPVWQMVADGLRNPWRFSFDRQTGDLWIGDVGQDTWEEIDYVPHAQMKPLLNFGWSVYEGDSKFKDAPLGPGTLDEARLRLPPRRGRVLGHRRLRLPRQRGAGDEGPLPLRGLLLRDRVERGAARRRARRRADGGAGRLAGRVRRGRTRRAVHRLARRRGLQALGAVGLA